MTIGASRDHDLISTAPAPAPRRPRALHAASPVTSVRTRTLRSPLTRRDRRGRLRHPARPVPQPGHHQRRRRRRDRHARVPGGPLRGGLAAAVHRHQPPAAAGVGRSGRAAAGVRVALPRGRPGGVPAGRASPRWRCSRLVAVDFLPAAPGHLARRTCSSPCRRCCCFSLVGRHLLRPGSTGCACAGHGLQRVLVVGRADAAVAVIEKLRPGAPARAAGRRGLRAPGRGVQVSHVHGVPVVGDPDQILDRPSNGRRPRRRRRLPPRPVRAVAAPARLGAGGARRRARGLAGDHRGRGPAAVDPAVAGLSLLHLERPTLGGAPDGRQERVRPGGRRAAPRARRRR